jgi:transcriptional regulator with XRE-family HTH domain
MEIDRLKRQLGLRFKELRLSKDMKQEDLERMGIFYLYYGKIERGIGEYYLGDQRQLLFPVNDN